MGLAYFPEVTLFPQPKVGNTWQSRESCLVFVPRDPVHLCAGRLRGQSLRRNRKLLWAHHGQPPTRGPNQTMNNKGVHIYKNHVFCYREHRVFEGLWGPAPYRDGEGVELVKCDRNWDEV